MNTLNAGVYPGLGKKGEGTTKFCDPLTNMDRSTKLAHFLIFLSNFPQC